MKEILEQLNLMQHHLGKILSRPTDLDFVHQTILLIGDLCKNIDQAIIKKRGDSCPTKKCQST